jgi:hypothetical protein
MIETTIKKGFLDLFYHDLKDQGLEKSNTLNLFTLKVRNNSFAYNELVEELGDQLHFFALSRNEVKDLIEKNKLNSLVRKAKEKLRVYSSNEGEIGEILLYCLLESHLNAPKILTKLELKTSNNDYVKGADGVHLLKLTDKDYQLILGESKLNSDLNKGIYEAFSSIKKLLTSGSQKLNFEVDLINSQLVKESVDDTTYNILKKIIIPSAKDDETYLDYSFGIFLGYNFDITDKEKALSNKEFRDVIRERVKNEINNIVSSINFQLKKSEFTGYDFYIYIIPFSDLVNTRKDLIKTLTK